MLRFRCASALFLCLVLCCAVSIAQNSVTFATHTSTAGLSPQAVYAIDINNDGIPDLVEDATSSGTNTVWIQLGNGDGTFQPQKQLAVLPETDNLAPMASGDFNGDGKVDLAFAVDYTNQLIVFLGNGDGTFQPMKVETVPFAGSSASQSFQGAQLLAADFNHDGKLDLAAFAQVATSTTNSAGVYILPGEGNGTFGTPRLVSSLKFVEDLALGDFDGDGNADIAVGENVSASETDLHVLYGSGAYGFTDSTVYRSICSSCSESDFFFASGDVNSDGRTDLFGFPNSNQLVVLTSQPDRQWTTFSMATTAALNQAVNRDDHAAPPPLLLGDFNGDGLMDLAAVGIQNAGTLQAQDVFDFFLANGSGGYTEQGVPVSGGIGNIVVGDFNLDGKPDVATINAGIQYPGTGAEMTVGLNQTEDGSWFSCPSMGTHEYHGAALCTPGYTAMSPVHFSAVANTWGQLRKIELWVDGKKADEQYHVSGSHGWLDGSGDTPLSVGAHRVVVIGADVDDTLTETAASIQVDPTCSAPSSPAVHICSPASGATLSVKSAVHIEATGTITGKLASMQLWIDGVKQYAESTDTRLDTMIWVLKPGTHRFAVLAVNTLGEKWEQAVNATVQ